jgi:hypothetical protein
MASAVIKPDVTGWSARGRRRWTTLASAAVLALVFGGDRARTQTASPIQGIDPLEILNLQVKPNVIIVLDSSGSMQETLDALDTRSGDTGVSKMHLAKTVLDTVIRANDTKASFMFGQYTQANSDVLKSFQQLTGNGGRFTYGAPGATAINTYNVIGQLITAAFPLVVDTTNNKVRYDETTTNAVNTVARQCTGTVASATYTSTALLVAAVQAAMNTATCTAGTPQNVYTVQFDTVAPNYRVQVSRSTANVRFRLRSVASAVSTDLWPDLGFQVDSPNGGNASTVSTGANTWESAASIEVTRRIAGGSDRYTDPAGTVHYLLRTNRFFNGQIISVLTNGTICSVTNGTAANGSATDPYYVSIQPQSACGTNAGAAVKFVLDGASFGGNSISCNGFDAKVGLAPCDTPNLQITAIEPFLKNELKTDLGRTGSDCTSTATCPIAGYLERPSGAVMVSPTLAGIRADGSTPIQASLRDIRGTAGDPAGSVKRNFGLLWDTLISPGVGNILGHSVSRERTIVLFVTDGDDTCAPDTNVAGINANDSRALAAAYQAQLLYDPIVGSVKTTAPGIGTLVPVTAGNADSIDQAYASSVTTYVVNFGNGASLTRSNWIAWGGSGLQQSVLNGTGVRWNAIPTQAQKDACVTCKDAFAAPDAATLEAILTAIINQGAQAGLFTAQQSLIGNVYELANTTDPGSPDPTDLKKRYNTIVPVRYEANFTLPGYQGNVVGYVNDGAGGATAIWAAGDKLRTLVQDGMAPATPATPTCTNSTPVGNVNGLCTFAQISGNGVLSAAKIKRRIYTTSGNGSFGITSTFLTSVTTATVPPKRVDLWPPTATLTTAPNFDFNYGIQGKTLAEIQALYKVCTPTPTVSQETFVEPMPTTCNTLVRGQQEVRQMILAYMAGAEPQLDADGLPRRTTSPQGELLFKPRDWVLAESTLATPALVTAEVTDNTGALIATPQDYTTEWKKFLLDPTGTITNGFGLSNDVAVMSVLYVAANDMLHAFRAARCLGCADTGGEELWGFVPFDQLNVLGARYRNRPATREAHDYMFTSSVRVATVLVPDATETTGIWRRILYLGRGLAGKYLTALDITGPGSYATAATSTVGPIPYWSRGNPDTLDGTAGGSAVNNATDKAAYAKMGQTWSVPAVAYVGRANKGVYPTTNKPRGVEFVAFVGSGYSSTATEGKTFYALDALTGDVAYALDVDAAATAAGMARTSPAIANAVVAAPSGFVAQLFSTPATTLSNTLGGPTTRIYFGDLHGHLWKLLTAAPGTLIPASDLGADQPVAVPVALLGLKDATRGDSVAPRMFVTSGNDSRMSGPFKLYGFRDEGDDTTTTTPGQSTENGLIVFSPVHNNFVRGLDPQVVARVPPFRGTVQPATVRGGASGIVLFGATRFNPPGTPEAPPPYPCRSSFDSIVYVLDAAAGGAAFNTGQGDGSYVLQKNSRLVGIGTAADPSPTGAGTKIVVDEGIKKQGVPPTAPAKRGVPPQTTTGGGAGTVPDAVGRNVAISAMGSSVCN